MDTIGVDWVGHLTQDRMTEPGDLENGHSVGFQKEVRQESKKGLSGLRDGADGGCLTQN